MGNKHKRTVLGWSETSSGTYHLRVEVAGQATRRIVACGARVEKDSEILTNGEMIKAASANGRHICRSCLDSPLLAPPSVKWGKGGKGGFIGDDPHNGETILRYDDLGIYICVTQRQLRKLHEKLGEYLALVEPPKAATVTITKHAPHRHTQGADDFIPSIKAVRDHTGMNLQEALALIKGKPLPLVVFTGDITKAESLAKDLESYGVSVEVKS